MIEGFGSMGDKSLRKKQYIIDKARDVFSEKGYRTVTMKDIVEACDISRGGLYLYFDGTRTLFEEVIKAEAESDDIFKGKLDDNATAADILVLFLVEQKKEILKKTKSLVKATYEYYFEDRPDKKGDFLKKDFDSTVKVLQKIIEIGIENDELICDDAAEAAKNIMFSLEGLKIVANTTGLTSEAIDKQFLYILSTLGVEDEK